MESSQFLNEVLISVVVILIIFIIISSVLNSIYKKFKALEEGSPRPILSNDFSSRLILEDLDYFIRRECDKTVTRHFTYAASIYAGSLDHSRLNIASDVISTERLNELIESTTKRILNLLSDSYRDRLAAVIYETDIDDYILDEVQVYLFAKYLELNQKARKKV